MIYETLKDSKVSLSRLSLGCWNYFDDWGSSFEKKMAGIIERALEKGVTLFDTAPSYGLGRSEEILGKALGKRRKKALVVTKAGLVLKKRSGRIEKKIDCSAENIEREVIQSLKRLKTDYIDFYLIHWLGGKAPVQETFLAMEKLKKSGKVLRIGCCNCSVDTLKEILEYVKIDAVQVAYNIIDRDIENDLLPFCKEQGIIVSVFSPLGRGVLAGKYDNDVRLTIDHHRKKDKNFQGEGLERSFRVLEAVKSVARKYKRTPAQIALRWVLENSCVGTVIFGASSLPQFDENVIAADFSLLEGSRKFLSGV